MQKNFGKIKNAFNDIFAESIVDKNAEKIKIVKRYIKAISENKILKLQFLVYNNIESKIDENQFSANLFITENLRLLEKYSNKEIMVENEKLVSLSQMVKSRLDEDYDNKGLHENITTLLFTKPSPVNIQDITESRMSLVKHINENTEIVTEEASDLPTSFIANIAVDKFNEKYCDLTENEHKVLRVILEGDNDKAREDVFNLTIKDCLVSVNTQLKEATNKEKLLDVKEKLLVTTFISESFENDIAKLLDLKRVLDKV